MAEKTTSVREGIRNSAVIKNPVLFEAIGLAPVVAMAVSVKTAVMLSVISTAELIIIESVACLLLKKLRHSFRVLIYAVLGVLINIPLFMFFNRIAPNETANVSIFLPVIAVNSLIALHCERIAVKNDFKTTLVDAVSASVGYVFIIFLLGILREVLGSGAFYSFDLKLPVKFSGLLLPFGGFLLLGFAAAFFKMLIKKKYPDEKPEAAFNLSEISDTHFEELKNAVEEDFNPFDGFFDSDESNSATEEQSQEEKQPKQSKLHLKRPEKPKKEKKEKKDRKEKQDIPAKPVADSVSEIADETSEDKPVKPERSRAYESEFDDILAELEAAKSAKAQKNEADEAQACEPAPAKDEEGGEEL